MLEMVCYYKGEEGEGEGDVCKLLKTELSFSAIN